MQDEIDPLKYDFFESTDDTLPFEVTVSVMREKEKPANNCYLTISQLTI